MAFIEYLIDFFKRAGFFVLGLILLPAGALITSIGSTRGTGVLPTIEPNPISIIIGIIVIITGLAMMGYAWRRSD